MNAQNDVAFEFELSKELTCLTCATVATSVENDGYFEKIKVSQINF